MNKNKGFTLIELMITIAILGILMAYAIPAYRNYIVKAMVNEGNYMASSYKLAVSACYAETNSLTTADNDNCGIGSATVSGNCVNTITVTAGTIVITYDCLAGSSGVAAPEVLVAEMTWQPSTASAGSLQWACSMNGTVANTINPCP